MSNAQEREAKRKIAKLLRPLPKDERASILRNAIEDTEHEMAIEKDAAARPSVFAQAEPPSDPASALLTEGYHLTAHKTLLPKLGFDDVDPTLGFDDAPFPGSPFTSSTLTGPVAPLITNTPTRGVPFDFSGGKPSKVVDLPLTDPRFDSHFGTRYPQDRGPAEDCPSLGYHDEPRSALLQWGAWIRTAVAAGHKFADVMAMASVRLDDLATRAGFKPDPVLIGGFSNVAGIWGATGFPCVMPTHKLAASLMATSMPPEHTPALTLPWPAFLIQIPDGILKMPPRPDQVSVADLPIRYVAIIDSQDPRVAKTHAGFGALGTGTATGAGTTVTRRFMIAAFFHDGRNFTTVFAAFDALEDIGRVPGDTRGTGAFDLVDDKEHALLNRMWEMLGRLFLGALVELDHPNHKSAVRAGPPPPKSPKSKDGHKRPKDTEPRAWIFDLRRDVKVDCRKFVGDYLAGNGKSPAVQVLVRGHHKRQPWGKDSMLRKWIHIEPYWKGPEDAPIAIRSHSMGDKS